MRLPLLLHEVVIGHAQATEELDHASVEVSFAKSAAPDHIEGQVLRLEFDLTLPQLNLAPLEPWLHHQHALSSGKPDLEGTHLRKMEEVSGLLGQLK